jgi:tripartite-type tricarboxylate transporter receptor subunit TctC
VPFTGAAPQMTALLGGHTDASFSNSDDLVRFKDKVRVLGFASPERFFAFPDVPTLKELGFDLVESVDRGIAVPVGTPKDIIAKLEKAFLDISNDPEIQKQMRFEGFVPKAIGHEEAVAYIEKLTKSYAEMAKEIKK